MERRKFLGLLAGAAATSMTNRAFPVKKHVPRRSQPPNVLYIFSDEHRWHSMSFTEQPQVQTPNMHRLAEEGVQFTQCISNYPVCSPHRAMLLTGRWPYQQGVIDNDIPLDSREMTLGKVFKKAGYRTGYIGKWHLGGVRAEPFGFDESLIWTNINSHWDKGTCHPLGKEPFQPKGYGAIRMTDQALEFLERNKANPFFLMLSWLPPHADFLAAPEEKKRLYPTKESLPFRPNVPHDASDINESKPIWDQNSWPFYQGYHAHVSAIDDELGRLLDHLDLLGITDNTIVVYSSDHGSMLGSHGLGGKRQPFEESIRVPFIVRFPGKIHGKSHVDALLGTIDIFPTLCGLAGLKAPRSCQGRDLSGIVTGGQIRATPSQIIMHIDKTHASGGQQHPAPLFRGVRTARYTYAVCADGPLCLFDNIEDPYQQNNLVHDAKHEELRTQLHEQLRLWLKRSSDPFQLPT
ncbi:MAG TPA: sulfatase [Candidatus Hydrogenedentes bacterium]|nr:sulfatase [Candidatus Hydrogenedentota bacterium]HOL78227.1 sulfatase [Candidatus Hydrogenedentota bacterium]HPO84532.1 sulfatase [Candidatus Hydrogenedentota bacterium]